MEDGQRSFTVTRYTHVGQRQERFEDEGGKGRYVSREPMNAARKAARQVFREASSKEKSKALYLEIRETTRGTPSNLYTYKATHKKTSERKDVGGRVIDKKMKIEIVSVPSKHFKGGAGAGADHFIEMFNTELDPEHTRAKTPEEEKFEEFLRELNENDAYKKHKDETNQWLRRLVQEMCSTQGRDDEEEVLMRISTEMIGRFQKLFAETMMIDACPTISMIIQEFESVLQKEQCLSKFSPDQRRFIRDHLISVLSLDIHANVQRNATTTRGGMMITGLNPGSIVIGCLAIVPAMIALPVSGIMAAGRALYAISKVSKEAIELSEKTSSRLQELISASIITEDHEHFFFELPMYREHSYLDETHFQSTKDDADFFSQSFKKYALDGSYLKELAEKNDAKQLAYSLRQANWLPNVIVSNDERTRRKVIEYFSKTEIFRELAIADLHPRLVEIKAATDAKTPWQNTVWNITTDNAKQVSEILTELSNRTSWLRELARAKYDVKALKKVQPPKRVG